MSQIPATSFETNPVTFTDSRANAGTGHSWRIARQRPQRVHPGVSAVDRAHPLGVAL